MEKSSSVFFSIISILIVGSIFSTYYRFFIARDYSVEAQIDCDPYTEACFVYVCNPLEEEGCTGDLLEDTFYYKFINRLARNTPLCGTDEEEACVVPPCAVGEPECSYTLCDTETAIDGEACTDPNTYEQEYPQMEEDPDAETGMTEDGVLDEEEEITDDVENDS